MSLCWAQVCLCHSRFQPRNVGFPPVASPEAIACSKLPCPGVFGCRILETDIWLLGDRSDRMYSFWVNQSHECPGPAGRS